MPGGQRLIGSHLTDRWVERANVAHFWRTIPAALKDLPEIEFRRMREFTIRSIEAQERAIEAAKQGAPTPRKGPKPGDTIIDPGQRDKF